MTHWAGLNWLLIGFSTIIGLEIAISTLPTHLPVGVILRTMFFFSPPLWQDTLGGGFDATQAFVGELANFNIWDRKLSSAEIYNLATCNSRAQSGNVLSWSESNIDIFGGATKWTFEPCRQLNWTALKKRTKKKDNKYRRPKMRIS